MEKLQLHDIKPLVEVHDYTHIYFNVLVGVLSVVIVGGLYLLWNYLKHRKKVDIRKEHLKKLLAITYEDPKKAAYELTKYGATFKDDDTRHKELYKNMLEHLDKYKYKKEVEPFDSKTISIINLYKEVCDV
ncbi:MAG: hypothetical protein GXO11_00555 [Epsilonproteobacteria bacterium]|nr:hypothetical protein [Campylobacterota bacterium]